MNNNQQQKAKCKRQKSKGENSWILESLYNGSKFCVFGFILILLIQSFLYADGTGISPSNAICFTLGKEITGSVKTSLYYDVLIDKDGIFTIELTPVSGEADLAVIHYSGSPAVESRKEGLETERIELKVWKGDRFMVRIISPYAKTVNFKLKANLDELNLSEKHDIRTREPILEPATILSSGKSASEAVMLPIGKLAAVSAVGTRYYKIYVPQGYILNISLYPVSGNSDLEANFVGTKAIFSAKSEREGYLDDKIYIPFLEESGYAIVKVSSANPEQGVIKYGISAKIRKSGIALSSEKNEPDDRNTLFYIFKSAMNDLGVPGWQNQVGINENLSNKILQLN